MIYISWKAAPITIHLCLLCASGIGVTHRVAEEGVIQTLHLYPSSGISHDAAVFGNSRIGAKFDAFMWLI